MMTPSSSGSSTTTPPPVVVLASSTRTSMPNNTPCVVCGSPTCTCGDDCQCTETLCRCQAVDLQSALGGKCGSGGPSTGVSKNSCCGQDEDPLAAPAPIAVVSIQKHKAELSIEGMTCTMCSQAVQRALERLEGVATTSGEATTGTAVQISLTTDTAVVEWSEPPTTIEDIQETIEAIGYQVVNVRRLQSNNDTTGQDGNDQDVDIEEDDPQERWQRLEDRQRLKVQTRRAAFLQSLWGTLPILVLTMILPLFHIHFAWLERTVFTIGNSSGSGTGTGTSISLEAFLLWILATPVQFITGFEFYKMSFASWKSGTAGMDVLVALGTTAAYTYACAAVLTGEEHAAHFFETSAVLISFVLAGKWMQATAVRRTSQALTALYQLQAKTAILVTRIIDNDNEDDTPTPTFDPSKHAFTEATVPIQEVHAGDYVKVVQGASIPADGLVVAGEMSVDESMVTGESIPVLKTPGSVVLGGTVCVETSETSVGAGFVHVTGVGSATALAQIVELVQQAQTRSVPIQALADQISAIFVPTVSVISVVTTMVWYALCMSNVVPAGWYQDLGEDAVTFSLLFGIACLVISCPCALGLATPTAVMVGTGVGAKHGVLIKGGEALQIGSSVDSVIFDKTGTLTVSRAAITDFVRWGDDDVEYNVGDDGKDHDGAMDHYILWLLASLERTSEHPLAKAVVRYAEDTLTEKYLKTNPFVQPTNFRALTGRGASGTISGNVSVAVGNRAFCSVLGLTIPPQAEVCMKRLEDQGRTAILAAMNNQICAVMGIADELKPDAAAAIVYLKEEMGVDVWMVTGDNARTANAIGRQLRLSSDRIISEALPAAKVEQVLKLQREGRVVAMIGDGVNDSPALAQADVGMSLGTGAEIAAEASDIVLVKGNVADVCVALDLSRVIFSRIKLNLIFSLIYNVLGIPIAAGVFYPLIRTRLPPTVAALAMALSSVSVVASSLALRFYRPPTVPDANISSGSGDRRRSTTAWARAMQQRRHRSRQSQAAAEQDALTTGLLASDHLAVSQDITESTQLVDNTSLSRIEEVGSNLV